MTQNNDFFKKVCDLAIEAAEIGEWGIARELMKNNNFLELGFFNCEVDIFKNTVSEIFFKSILQNNLKYFIEMAYNVSFISCGCHDYDYKNNVFRQAIKIAEKNGRTTILGWFADKGYINSNKLKSIYGKIK